MAPARATRPLVQGGQIRAIAVAGARPFAATPGVPAMASQLPDFVIGSWRGLRAAGGTPPVVPEKPPHEIAPGRRQAAAGTGLRALRGEPHGDRALEGDRDRALGKGVEENDVEAAWATPRRSRRSREYRAARQGASSNQCRRVVATTRAA